MHSVSVSIKSLVTKKELGQRNLQEVRGGVHVMPELSLDSEPVCTLHKHPFLSMFYVVIEVSLYKPASKVVRDWVRDVLW